MYTFILYKKKYIYIALDIHVAVKWIFDVISQNIYKSISYTNHLNWLTKSKRKYVSILIQIFKTV